MKIYLNLDSKVDAFAFKKDHVRELEGVFPGLETVRVHKTSELGSGLADADFVATWRFPADFYGQAPRLKAVFTPAAGREYVDADPNGRVPVFYGTFHGILMAESLLSMMLYFNRKMEFLIDNKGRRLWSREGLSECRSLMVQRALIVGYGNIGRACARALSALGCSVTGVRRTPSPSDTNKRVRKVVRFEEMGPFLERADQVVLALPGGEQTAKIFTRDHFARMKRSAYLYNLGRGSCYLEEDLIWAIETGRIAGAGLDVFAEEPLPETSKLWDLPNVFIMPHASAIYDDYMDLFLAEMMGKLQSLISEAR